MKHYLVSDLLQKWIESGKQPVVLFSSLDDVIHESPELIPVTPLASVEIIEPTLLEPVVIEPAFVEPVEQIEPIYPVFQPVLEFPEYVEYQQAPEIEIAEVVEEIIETLPEEVAAEVIVEPILTATPQEPFFQLPTINLPQLTWPTIVLPRISLPKPPTLPTWPEIFHALFGWITPIARGITTWFQDLPWAQALHWGSRLAYGTAIAAVVMFFTPIMVIESQNRWNQFTSHIAEIRLQSQVGDTVPTPTPTPEPEINTVEDYFSLEIPRLKIASRIIPNVSTTNIQEYESALKIGVAHAQGTGLPDDTSANKTIYLFAHSTNATFNIQRYNAQFYALKDTVAGDIIKVRYWGKDYSYTIQETKVVDANDTSYLKPQMDGERLILQTCYPPGTTWKRLVVIATPTKE